MVDGAWDIHSLHRRRQIQGANSERRRNSNPNTLVRKNSRRTTAICYTSAVCSDPTPHIPDSVRQKPCLFCSCILVFNGKTQLKKRYRELVCVSFLAIQRLRDRSRFNRNSRLVNSKVPSEPVDDCIWLPLLQLLSVAARAVVARFWVSIVGATGCPAATGLLFAQTTGTPE